MNVGQLKKMLDEYPDDMEVITDLYSDFDFVNKVITEKAVPKGQYIMRSHETMNKKYKAVEKTFLFIGV